MLLGSHYSLLLFGLVVCVCCYHDNSSQPFYMGLTYSNIEPHHLLLSTTSCKSHGCSEGLTYQGFCMFSLFPANHMLLTSWWPFFKACVKCIRFVLAKWCYWFINVLLFFYCTIQIDTQRIQTCLTHTVPHVRFQSCLCYSQCCVIM